MKKYFKYIMFSIALLFSFMLNVNAIKKTCVYDWKPNIKEDGQTKYRNFTFSFIVGDNGEITQMGMRDNDTNKFKDITDTGEITMEEITYRIEPSVVEAVKGNDGVCPQLGGLAISNKITGTSYSVILPTANTENKGQYTGLTPRNSNNATNINETDPIVGNVITRTVTSTIGKDTITMEFSKRKSGKYHYKMTINGKKTYENDVEGPAMIRFGNYYISTSEFNDFWTKSSSTTLYTYNNAKGENKSKYGEMISFNPNEEEAIKNFDKDYKESKVGNREYRVIGVDSATNDSVYISLKSLCSDDKIRKVVRVIGYLGVIVKILVPVGLIIFGAISFFKVILSGTAEEDVKKKAVGFAYKIIAAIVIFVLPTIIYFVLGLADEEVENDGIYIDCKTCLFDPGNCK